MQESTKLKGLPIGLDDFKNLINGNGYYVDKTLFIKEIIDDISKVKLITRPMLFGRTLNLSMLRYFFEKTDEDNSYLFKGLKIWQQGEKYTARQGQYPVVNLSFKNVRERKYQYCYESLKIQISEEFRRHDYILDSDKICESDKEMFNEIIECKADRVELKNSLKFLAELLNEYHGKEVIVLIEEYDTPITHGCLYGYYNDIMEFMGNFLCAGLKSNTSLRTGIMTGIFRFENDSIFSGFNNLIVYSIVEDFYTDQFGFTEKEVEEMMSYYGMSERLEEVKHWYNGYVFGKDTVIYNPWSILNYIDGKTLQPYWVDTLENDIMSNILLKTEWNVKKALRLLMEGGELSDITVNTGINFRDIINRKVLSEELLWSFLFVCGYLKLVDKRVVEGDLKCNLKIPNIEIQVFYRDVVKAWFGNERVAIDNIRRILFYLVEGNIEEFKKEFEYLVRKTFSYFDVGRKTAENFYHAFILGMLVNLEGKYRIVSNRELGKGRPDVIIIPKDTSKKGVVMEFKVCDSEDDDKMKQKALDALEKVKSMNYRDEIIESGIGEIVEVAVVFCGKKVHVEWR